MLQVSTGGRFAATSLIAAYVAVYLLVSSLDLWSTALALRLSGTSEANVFVTDGGLYNSARAWLITFAGGAVVTGMFAFGVMRAPQVAERWLERPVRSFLEVRSILRLNPFSHRSIHRSPLHMMSFALAFVVLRLLAGVNNLLIYEGYTGPIGAAVRAVGRVTTPLLGFVLAGGGLYILLVLAVAPAAARLISWVRGR